MASCSAFNKCKNTETNNLSYPVDPNSLYADKIYDTQTAANRCYALEPRMANIIEGFGSITWEKVIKVGIIILLLILFISLICDYSTKEISIQDGGRLTESFFELTAITELNEY